jgi:CO dehydrogenase/acetyl-CoA synthase delta subunit
MMRESQKTSNKDCGCGCGNHDNKKSVQTFQSTNVSIMPSMENVESSTIMTENGLAKHEKPGYILTSFVESFIETDIGSVPVAKTKMDQNDIKSTILVRIGLGRNDYKVAPGLYCVGTPDKNSEVLVTANFKLTFDHVRRELKNISAWILVLDTKGINVWCAAGKGTFSTRELVNRIKLCSLEKIVDHKRVIVPQLGATGVAARQVKKESGFRVVYGPIRANDIPGFLKNNKKADRKMRAVTFTFIERLVLTPVEINVVMKPAFITAIILIALSGIGPDIFSFSDAMERGVILVSALFTGIIAGAFFTPAMLPYIPFKSFAAKGIISGSVFAILFMMPMSSLLSYSLASLSIFLFIVTISSFLSMNFTGATPFTSPSGVEKEMKRFIPVQLSALLTSAGLWIYSIF